MSTMISPRGKQVIRSAVASACRRIVRAETESIGALALRLGVSGVTVRRWIDGFGYPNFIAAQRIAPLVGIDPRTGKAAS